MANPAGKSKGGALEVAIPWQGSRIAADRELRPQPPPAPSMRRPMAMRSGATTGGVCPNAQENGEIRPVKRHSGWPRR